MGDDGKPISECSRGAVLFLLAIFHVGFAAVFTGLIFFGAPLILLWLFGLLMVAGFAHLWILSLPRLRELSKRPPR